MKKHPSRKFPSLKARAHRAFLASQVEAAKMHALARENLDAEIRDTARYEAYSRVHLSKAERRGKTEAEIQELRRRKYFVEKKPSFL